MKSKESKTEIGKKKRMKSKLKKVETQLLKIHKTDKHLSALTKITTGK